MATIKDVAREAGLTVTTVSRVLNNRGYISDDARKRVSEAMKKLNYQPNEMARSLQNRKSNIIGVIVPHIKHPYFAEMISRIEGEAYKHGYRILLFNTQEKIEKGKEYLDICTSNRVAGIILFSGSISVELFSELEVPVVTMERKIDSGTASVECDNKAGGELAARKLIDSGCKKLLLIGSNAGSEDLPADNRVIGFREVCEKEGIEYHEISPRLQDYFDMVYQGLVREALMEYPETDGIFASSDVIGAQIIQVCKALGKSIPEDLKLVGFDDTMISRLTMPQLTTIHQPIKEMAELAVKIIKDASDGKIVPQQTILPVSLIERESTVVATAVD